MVLMDLAEILRVLGWPREAEARWRTAMTQSLAVGRNDDAIACACGLAEALEDQKKYAEADRVLSAVGRTDNADNEVRLRAQHVRILLKAGKGKRAQQVFDAGLALGRKHGLSDALTSLYMCAGDGQWRNTRVGAMRCYCQGLFESARLGIGGMADVATHIVQQIQQMPEAQKRSLESRTATWLRRETNEAVERLGLWPFRLARKLASERVNGRPLPPRRLAELYSAEW